MATKLVIVESPAKAKTIGSYLGSDYEVVASVGHIRDLPTNAKGLPPELKKKWWADYAVDVDNGFEPIYEVSPAKQAQVSKLRQAMKGKTELVLATDEDREGESISWHLLSVLNPSKSTTIKRIAFHEITKEAILNALKNPRQIDEDLVEAQETRRILDRLYGYTLSPVLWSLVTKNLSAGRVQSPAVRLIVEREMERRRFRSATYWDLRAHLEDKGIKFTADLQSVDGKSVASGSDFDPLTGQLKSGSKAFWLDEAAASTLATALEGVTPYAVHSVEAKDKKEYPAPPFMTTTLQQEANRKFGFAADRTMRIAQTLYEGVQLGGEQIGLITYMRTDSLTLSGDAVNRIREHIGKQYSDCLPAKPNVYTSKVRNAQEAHEAIRPTDIRRRPADLANVLNQDQLKIYDLIWKRTVACQMKPADVRLTEVILDATPRANPVGKSLKFRSSGKQILFDGFRRVYFEDSDDPEAEMENAERRLPILAQGQSVACQSLGALSHTTQPPARYTDASLIKKLEEMGIGRPSTYASIISVITERGYVRKQGRQLIPTFLAVMTMEVLQNHFGEFVEYDFTRELDESLDDIANGKSNRIAYLEAFFLGHGDQPGLKAAVESRRREIPYPNFHVGDHPESGKPIIVRLGKGGDPFLQLGDADEKTFASVPEDLAPGDLTLEHALELFDKKPRQAESIGVHPASGRNLLLKQRQGYYLEVERTPEEIEAKVKPTWVSLPQNVDPRTLTQDDLDYLCSLPKEIGKHTDAGAPITFHLGKFGPYIQCEKEIRNVPDWRGGLTLAVGEAVAILAAPKTRGARAATGPLQDFGELEGAAGAVRVLAGRFGPYVTDGEVNATLPRGTDPLTLTAERALELLAAKRAAGPSTKPAKRGARGRTTAARPAAAKKAPAKKPGAKKSTTKKPKK